LATTPGNRFVMSTNSIASATLPPSYAHGSPSENDEAGPDVSPIPLQGSTPPALRATSDCYVDVDCQACVGSVGTTIVPAMIAAFAVSI
jgi:hypothetical protein